MTAAASLLLDTCAVIYLANGSPMNAASIAAIGAAAGGDGVLVSPVSAWEVGLLSSGRAKVRFMPDPKTWFGRVLAQAGIRLTPLTPEIAIDSSGLPGPVHGDPADRLLIATARSIGVPIVTRDRLILRYARTGHVRVIAC